MNQQEYNVVLLTGAGCSSIVGLKTLKAIIEGFQGASTPLDERVPGVELVRETWRIVRAEKGESATLEDLIGRLKIFSEAVDLFKNNFVLADLFKVSQPLLSSGHYKRVWEDALSVCFRLMIDNYGPQMVQPKGLDIIADILKSLGSKNNKRLHLFTTNYDCVLNVMSSRNLGLNFHSHINNEIGHFENDWFLVNDKTFNESNQDVYIHRLHGCIAWYSKAGSPYGIHEVFGAGGERLVIEDQNKLNQMAIKLISNEKVGSMPAFLLAFQELYRALENCKCLFIWGHSFRDLELLRTILRALQNRQNNPFKITYIDPYLEPGDVMENIRSTMSGELTASNSMVSLQRIDWVIQDGYQKLKEKVDEHLALC